MAARRVAHYGNPGANTEEAALTIFGTCTTVPCTTFAAIFEAVAARTVDFGVVAVENSQAGSINDTYDLLLTHYQTVTVCGEFDLWVHHYLLGLPGATLDQISVAFSHPQALAQTHDFLAQHGIRGEVSGDTAGSARRVHDEGQPEQAAIAGLRAAELYALQVLAGPIEDNRYNFTKFLVLAPVGATVSANQFRLPPVAPGVVKRSLVLSVPNTPGSLYAALGPLATNGLNLTKIESRPARERPWDYYFYVDIEGDPTDPRYETALDELRQFCHFVTVLGSYQVLSSARSAAPARDGA